MRIAIMQPYVFPYIGYFQLIHSVDKFVLYDDVNYIKQGWINRNNILINGEQHTFVVPVEKVSSFRHIKDHFINDNQDWKKNFLRKVEVSYGKAPYFRQSYSILQGILKGTSTKESIAKFAHRCLISINSYLGIQTPLIISSEVYDNQALRKGDRVIDICQKEGGTVYINAVGGQKLYDKAVFEQAGLNLLFLEPKKHSYKQFENNFVPWLSIIDIMMFNDIEQIRLMLNEYSLI